MSCIAVRTAISAGSIRKSDYPARYEGTTFAIVLPQTTPTFIRMVANRIRTAIERAVFVYNGEELSVTASMGGVCITRTTSARDAQTLIKVADKLLYKAKDNGRNCVEVFTRSTLGHAREESQ